MIKSKFISNILTLILDDGEYRHEENQLKFLIEKEIKYTGSGVFIEFKLATGIEKFKSSKLNLTLNGLTIKSPELKVGAEATLFFKNGLIDYLEIWSYDGEYPKNDLKEYLLRQEWKGSSNREIRINE